MSKLYLSIAVALALSLSAVALRAAEPPPGAAAEASLDALLNAIQSNRKALIAANLALTDAEAAGFWPVYDRYAKEIGALGDRQVAVIQDYIASYSTLSDDKAKKLITEYLTIDADRVALRRAYIDEFAKALPGRKVARLYQIENKMDAVIRYDLARTIPVVEEKSAAPAPNP